MSLIRADSDLIVLKIMFNVQKFDSSTLDRGFWVLFLFRKVSNRDGTLVFLKYMIQEVLLYEYALSISIIILQKPVV
jgi:hypothetical protein